MRIFNANKINLTLSMLILLTFIISVNATANMVAPEGMTPVESKSQIRTDATKLVVATRHDSSIYQKYAEYFANSDLGASVGITSASEIDFVAPTTYSAFKTALTNPAIGASVAWGGGPTVFNNLATDGLLRSLTDTSLINWIDANVSDSIAGADMKKYDDDDKIQWVAAAISSFGFTVNNATLQSRGLPFPTSWEDLASPAFYTGASEVNIAMGNAPDTTSNTRIYQIILQKFGWERGWEIIYSMAGNSNIYGGSVETRAAVESGDVAVAMTIDFYGIIANSVNPNCQYVIPKDSSIVNGDPIAISANAPDLAAARAFTKYVLSAEGQALWLDDRINRLPVRDDSFDAARALVATDSHISDAQVDTIENLFTQTLANQGITFDEDLALSLEETMRYHFEATITRVHSNLRTSWSSIADNFNAGSFPEQRLAEIVDIFGDPAITQTEAQNINDQIISDPNFRNSKMGEWETFAIQKYTNAKNAVTEPFTITSSTVVTTTDSSGNTITSTSDVTVTSTASTVDDSFDEVPIASIWIAIALVAPVILLRKNHKGRKN